MKKPASAHFDFNGLAAQSARRPAVGRKMAGRAIASAAIGLRQRHCNDAIVWDLAALANEAPFAGEPMVGLGNEIAATDGDGWARIPYGEHEHELGIQRFGRAQAEEMVSYFKNTWNRLKRALSGLPIYKGHPDLADVLRKQRTALANEAQRAALDRKIAELERQYPDKREYGTIADMEARDDGLYIKPVLGPAGVALVNEGRDRFSPHWLGKILGEERGRTVYGPAMFLSIGLTDRPNIAGTSLVNTKPATMNKTLLIQLLAALGRTPLANEATDDQFNAELTAALPIATALAQRPEATALANEQTARGTAETQLNETKAKLNTTETALANEKSAHASTIKARNEALVADAVKAGRILEANRTVWLGRLERDFAVESVALANESGALKTTSRTNDLGNRKEPNAAADQFTALVNEAMPQHGNDWAKAWKAVKATKQGKELFDKMDKQESTD
ncbi:phage protease [Horticoccus luteus]|uniref:Phage protease n=1 Tax=Horticoccus luteus TaxID=2862869 RepID=A0A8F9TWB5_9BACT|nr:phage protease [Horticoccus luteus]QYM80280.1 phage protease [Horticoccus luteus]